MSQDIKMPAATGAQRAAKCRQKKKTQQAAVQKALAIATRPPLGSRPILLLEEVIENAVEIASRVSQARDGTSDTERSAFRRRLFRQEHLADALELYEPDPTSSDAAEFKAAVQCIRAVCASALMCRSLRS